MICSSIKGTTLLEAKEKVDRALEDSDLIELRLDYLSKLDLPQLASFRSRCQIPIIFTARRCRDGGHWGSSEEERIAMLFKVAELKPDYIDIESDLDDDTIQKFLRQFPEVKLILSYHDITKTPDLGTLYTLYTSMNKIPAAYYKIALMASDSSDALKLLCWAQGKGEKLIAISMGHCGQVSRIIAPLIGGKISYASSGEGEETAEGQLTAQQLCKQYCFRTLGTKSVLFGLIGDPVAMSIGDKTHNALIGELDIDGVYIKMKVSADELVPFLQYARKLPFKGISVTMPLKEAVVPLLDWIDPNSVKINAVNTLLFRDGKICGYNTDGAGALDSLEKIMPVQGKKVLIIGAGGSGRAIAHEAKRRSGDLLILSRNFSKARELADSLSGESLELSSQVKIAERRCDFIINCTPTEMPIEGRFISPNCIVMDIKTIPRESALLKCARDKGCTIVYGYEMFIEQAVGQFAIWLEEKYPKATLRDHLKSAVEKALQIKN